MDNCRAWLRSIVTIPEEKTIYSVAHNQHFLSRDFGPYNLKCTTDLVFVLKRFVDSFNTLGGGGGLKLLTRKIDSGHVKQIIVQLIASSTYLHFPVVVLTDLGQFWQFSWLAESGIQQSRLGFSQAIAFIDHFMSLPGRHVPCHMIQFIL